VVIEKLVVNLSRDPFNPAKNFDVAVQYEKDNQTASAVSFYLRTIEYGYDTHPLLVYASLLKLAHCFNDQKDRAHTVSNAFLQAIAYIPGRPEAYFLYSRFHERAQNWQECYTFACLGMATYGDSRLPVDVGYDGYFCLAFEKAVSAYWIGRRDESLEIFTRLNALDLPTEYSNAVRANLEKLNASV
jgi:hypothetical protein